MENTVVDKDNNKVLVNYLYIEKLVNLGENFFGNYKKKTSWPFKPSRSLLSSQSQVTSINRAGMIPDSPFFTIITKMLTACNSFSKVLNALTLLTKI